MKSFGARSRGLRLERMTASPRWAGEGFRNVHPIPPSLRDPAAPTPASSELLCTRGPRYPEAPLMTLDPRVAWQRTPASGLRVTWLGHSTVLIEIDGVRLLTDPVWGERASPFRLIGPKRFQPVPVRLRDMPPVDAVLISHDHYDHLDYPTIHTLARHSAVPMVTSLGVGAHLEAWGVAPGAHHRARLVGVASPARHRRGGHGGTVAALFRPRIRQSQRDAVVIVRHPFAAARCLLQRRHRPDARVRDDPRAARPLRRRDARNRRVACGLGSTSTWAPPMRSRLTRGWAAVRFCPSTGAPSAWPCTPGTSRSRPCCRWRQAAICRCCCHNQARPSSRAQRRRRGPGGAGRQCAHRPRPMRPCQHPKRWRLVYAISLGRWTDGRIRRDASGCRVDVGRPPVSSGASPAVPHGCCPAREDRKSSASTNRMRPRPRRPSPG